MEFSFNFRWANAAKQLAIKKPDPNTKPNSRPCTSATTPAINGVAACNAENKTVKIVTIGAQAVVGKCRRVKAVIDAGAMKNDPPNKTADITINK